MGTLHGDQCTVLGISCFFLLRMRNVSEKSCRENQNTHFVFSNFFLKSYCLWENEKKILYSWKGHRWLYGTCALLAGYQGLQIHMQNM